MLPSTKGLLVAAVAGVTGVGAAVICPLCGGSAQAALAQQTSDTATARLHISRMTCGSCPTTARVALNKLPGVYGATVTLDDSLGVVRYDPRRVTPAEIAAHLTRLTGFGAMVI
jgi:copper chaperone CopZ